MKKQITINVEATETKYVGTVRIDGNVVDLGYVSKENVQSEDEAIMIFLANALKFEPAELLNLNCSINNKCPNSEIQVNNPESPNTERSNKLSPIVKLDSGFTVYGDLSDLKNGNKMKVEMPLKDAHNIYSCIESAIGKIDPQTHSDYKIFGNYALSFERLYDAIEEAPFESVDLNTPIEFTLPGNYSLNKNDD